MRCSLGNHPLEWALGALLLGLPSAGMAQTIGQAVHGGSPDEVRLVVNVTASVSAYCAFTLGAAPSGSYSVGDIERAFSIDVPFRMTCNSPSRVGIVSDNGGLKAPGILIVPPGYARLAPYQIMLRLVGELGSSAAATCQSPTLTAGAAGCVFRGPATATQGLRLGQVAADSAGSFIRISSPGYSDPAILIASNSYADRLTVTISPAI